MDLATPSQVLEICSNVPRTCILTRSQAIQIHTKGQEALVKDAPNFGWYTQVGGKQNKYTLLKGPAPGPIKRDILTNGNIDCSKFQHLLFSSSKKLKLDYRFGRKWIHFEFPSFSVGTGNLLTFATSSPEVLWVTLHKDTSEWPTESTSWWIKQRGYTSFLDKHPKSQRKHIQQCIVYKITF